MKSLIALVCLTFASLAALGQAAAPAPAGPSYNTFSLELSPVSLPGNHQTVAGTESGAWLTLTPNLDLGNKDLAAPGQNFQYFSGAFQYRLPFLSNKLNNVSTLNGLKFQFGLTGSLGVDRITNRDTQHFGATAGGFVNYSLGGGKYSLGAKVEYVKFPGLTNNNFTIALDPAIHF